MSSTETKNTSSKEVAATTTTKINASIAKKALLATNFFVETNRMEAFVAVYYITYEGWNSVMIGIISLVMNITMIVFQTPAGDFLDKTAYKKWLWRLLYSPQRLQPPVSSGRIPFGLSSRQKLLKDVPRRSSYRD